MNKEEYTKKARDRIARKQEGQKERKGWREV